MDQNGTLPYAELAEILLAHKQDSRNVCRSICFGIDSPNNGISYEYAQIVHQDCAPYSASKPRYPESLARRNIGYMQSSFVIIVPIVHRCPTTLPSSTFRLTIEP
jgi:hypothetical protein